MVLDGIMNMLKMAGPNVEQIANLIEECDGTAKIEVLQNHENVDIYKLAYDIIEQYFNDEGAEEANIAPQVNNGAFEFEPTAPGGAGGGQGAQGEFNF